ncbi:hypothetical protein BGX27_000847, partial [Mortierella sp. AM989]
MDDNTKISSKIDIFRHKHFYKVVPTVPDPLTYQYKSFTLIVFSVFALIFAILNYYAIHKVGIE